MGDKADCDRCGCVVPFHMATLGNRRLMLKETLKARFAPKQPAAFQRPEPEPGQIAESSFVKARPEDAF
jgi:hypothetical protein